MAAPPLSLLLVLLAASITSSASSSACSSVKFSGDRLFARCASLPEHNATLHWTLNASNSSLSIAFVAAPPSPDGWVAWAINPTATGMVGSQAILAYNAATAVAVRTYAVESYSVVRPSRLSFDVWDMAAESVGGSTRVFAKLKLPPGKEGKVNHVWQVGRSVAGGVPSIHALDRGSLSSKGTLDLEAGEVTSGGGDGGGDSKDKQRNIHGILNVLSWGIMFPLGVIIARYVKVFPSADPLWFYLHVSCQVTAYALGTAGWGIGMKLGNESDGIVYSLHRDLGIALFCLASLQVTALFYRPHKGDKNRVYWEICHHTVGFTIAVMGIFNVIKGIDILSPAQKWQTAYFSVLTVLLAGAVLLEVITWTVLSKRDSENASSKTP